jgi:hypothetical protein
MSNELLFELIEKSQWTFERKIESSEKEKSWPLNTSLFIYLNYRFYNFSIFF